MQLQEVVRHCQRELVRATVLSLAIGASGKTSSLKGEPNLPPSSQTFIWLPLDIWTLLASWMVQVLWRVCLRQLPLVPPGKVLAMVLWTRDQMGGERGKFHWPHQLRQDPRVFKENPKYVYNVSMRVLSRAIVLGRECWPHQLRGKYPVLVPGFDWLGGGGINSWKISSQ